MNKTGTSLVVILLILTFILGGIIAPTTSHHTSQILESTQTVTIGVAVPVYRNGSVPASISLRGAIDGSTSIPLHEWAQQVEASDLKTVTIFFDSHGGFYYAALAEGNGIAAMRANGVTVDFVMVNNCFSACFFVSTFATRTFATANTTLGFNHSPSEYSIEFWNQMLKQMAQNKGWTDSYTNIVMQESFDASNAVKAGVITGIYEG